MKTLKQVNLKYLQYIFLLGPILIIIGLTAGYVAGNWMPIPLSIIIAGIVIIFLWLLFPGNSRNSFWGRRSTQTSTNALVSILAVIVILGLINFMGTRYAVRVDLTESKLFTLSLESQKIVSSLQQPVKVVVFENDNFQVRELLQNYQRYGSQFSYQFVDPQSNPGLAEKFNVQRIGEVHVESGKQRQLVQILTEGEQLSEAKLTNTIERVTSDRADKIYFVQGHGEHPLEAVARGLSQAISTLKDKNYTTESLNLVERQTVPEDAAAVVIAGPKKALFESEVAALKAYLQRGGNLLLMVNPNANTGLDSLLKEWGVKLDNKLVIDASGQGSLVGLGAATPLISSYGNHPITKDFGNNFSFYPLARPIEVTPIKGVEQTPLLLTDDKSWAESTPEQQPLEFNPESDRQGPLYLGVALSRTYLRSTSSTSQTTQQPSPTPAISPTPTATKPPENTNSNISKGVESRLVILGNSDFATDGLFDKQLNGDVFLNSVSWLSQHEEKTLSIRPKEQKNRRINITPVQATLLSWTALLFMPLIGFTTAGILWWKRR